MPSPWDKPEGKEWETYQEVISGTLSFMRLGAPAAFIWLEWCAILAAIRYAQIKTGAWPLLAIQIILAILLWGYFMQLFSTTKIEWLPKSELLSASRMFNWVISLAATAGMLGASYWLAQVFVQNPL